jgi:hypothetical protein
VLAQEVVWALCRKTVAVIGQAGQQSREQALTGRHSLPGRS